MATKRTISANVELGRIDDCIHCILYGNCPGSQCIGAIERIDGLHEITKSTNGYYLFGNNEEYTIYGNDSVQ